MYAYHIEIQDCEKAQCGRKEDREMIRSKILQRQGGWAKLNERMAHFRKPPIDVRPERRTAMQTAEAQEIGQSTLLHHQSLMTPLDLSSLLP